MRLRTAAAMVALLPLACDLVPTGAADGVPTTVVLDLGALVSMASESGQRTPTASQARLYWDFGSGVKSSTSPIDGGKATFTGIIVPEGKVDFWAGAETASGTVLAWSLRHGADARGTFKVDVGLARIDPVPAFEVLEPARTIGSADGAVTLDISPRQFQMEIRNDRKPSPVVDSARAAGHDVTLTWRIDGDPRVEVSQSRGALEPGESDTVTVTEKPEFFDHPIAADLSIGFVFAADVYDPKRLRLREAAVHLEKTTNGDTTSWHPPGPSYAVGDPVTWTYVISNVGTVSLKNLIVKDSLAHIPPDSAFTVECLQPDSTVLDLATLELPPNSSVTCIAVGTAVNALYSNVAHVEAEQFGTTVLSPPDTNWYQAPGGNPCLGSNATVPPCFGGAPSVDIQVSTNGRDAESSATAVHVLHGQTVDWLYLVTNDGDWPLTDIVVRDHTLRRQIKCPAALAPKTWVACAPESGTATPGPYAASATVTANGREPGTGVVRAVVDHDASHYFGDTVPDPDTARIDIEKTTNSVQADSGPGPNVPIGAPVRWEYVVTNTGTVGLTSIIVTDSDPALEVECIAPPLVLSPGGSFTCEALGTAMPDRYGNEGTVTARSVGGGAVVMDADSSHYRGVGAQGSG